MLRTQREGKEGKEDQRRGTEKGTGGWGGRQRAGDLDQCLTTHRGRRQIVHGSPITNMAKW